MILDSTSSTIQISLAAPVATRQPSFVGSYNDGNNSLYRPEPFKGTASGTSQVTMVPSPAAGVQRQVVMFTVSNRDTQAATVTLNYDDDGSDTQIISVVMEPGDVLTYSQSAGFSVKDRFGAQKQTGVGPAEITLTGDVTGSGEGEIETTVEKIGGVAPGSAAFKDASDDDLDLLASVSGAAVIGNFPAFADVAGTIVDSGKKPADFPTFNDVFVGSGPNAKNGLVPSPGATAFTPPRVLQETGGWAVTNGPIYVSSFGQPTGVNDATTFQAAFNAAVTSNRTLVVDNPGGVAGTRWFLGTTIQDTSGQLGTPRTISVNTTTGVYTFDRDHYFSTGDVVSFVGTNMGSGGGLTQVNAYTEYFFNRVSATTGRLYNTRANAVAGGATGLYIPSTGNTTAATLVTLTTAANLTSGSGSVTVTDGSKVVIGDTLNFAGSGGVTYYKVSGVVGNVVSFTPNYSGSTINSGATVWTSICDVTSTLSLEQGSTCSFTGPGTNNNSFGNFIVLSLVGNTVHFNMPPNASLPSPGTPQTLVLNIWIDPKQNVGRKFKMVGQPGAVICKILSGFAGNALFQWDTVGGVELEGLEFWGRTYGYTADPNITPGDDGIRISGSFGIKLKNCTFRYCGDSAWRFQTGSYFAAAKSASYPNAGTYSTNVEVDGCFVYDSFQVSTTNTSNDYQGGARDYWMKNCYFENIGGAVKFATRCPGGENIYIINNIVKKAGRHAFELDSFSNYRIEGNTIYDCNKFGIFVIANNLQPVGFPFNECLVKNNIITAGPNTGTTTSSGGIYVNPDLYPDGTLWNFRGLQILDNKVYDMPGSSLPIMIAGGCYTGLRIERNTIDGCATANSFIRMTIRANATPSFDSAIVINDNIARNCTGTKATMLYMTASNGTAAGPFIRGVYAEGNQLDATNVSVQSGVGNDGRMFHMDYVADVTLTDNRCIGYLSAAVYVQTAGANLRAYGNSFTTQNDSFGGMFSLNGVNGVFVADNVLNQANAGAGWLNVDRLCQNVRIGWNDLSQSTRKTYGVGNVPITTAANGYQTREEYYAAAPNAGTWKAGDRYWLTAPAANTSMGGICTVGGTYTAITATGDSVTGNATITNVSAMTNICVGMFITHPGFTGTRTVVSMGANSVTVNANATGDSTGGSLAVAAPTFKAMPSIAA